MYSGSVKCWVALTGRYLCWLGLQPLEQWWECFKLFLLGGGAGPEYNGMAGESQDLPDKESPPPEPGQQNWAKTPDHQAVYTLSPASCNSNGYWVFNCTETQQAILYYYGCVCNLPQSKERRCQQSYKRTKRNTLEPKPNLIKSSITKPSKLKMKTNNRKRCTTSGGTRICYHWPTVHCAVCWNI